MFSPSPLPRTLEASFRDLGSQKPATRASAIRDVVRHGRLGDEARDRAVRQLERMLRDDPVPAVRSEAALGLAELGGCEALPSLIVAVEDQDPFVRQMALTALGELGDGRARGRVTRALGDARPEVRYQALIAFTRLHGDEPSSVASALAAAMADRDESIRYIAVRLAEEPRPDGSGPVRDERVEGLATRLADEATGRVAVAAALYLSRLGHPRAVESLLDVVAERIETTELEDEQACVEACGELGLRAAIPFLERRAWGQRRVLRQLFSWGAGDHASCAWHARIALARLGHGRARAEIAADLDSSQPAKREGAVVAAGRARLGDLRPRIEKLAGAVDRRLLEEALANLSGAGQQEG